jgi:glutamine amidotransferase
MWALRYPDSHELYVLDRHHDHTTAAPGPEFDLRTKRIRAQSEHLCTRSSVVFASEPMDDDPRWGLLEPGELVHVDAGLRINRSMVLPDPPVHLLRQADLSTPVRQAQHTSV